ncbi:cysteinyl leukotriene receptor 1-like [Gigantopelta aegis]|uniref:cysteinyl leukotriene receptor 1-like n=1 Tax=Gigantopelta aegis TaxID=1735272 RepID=UPI001B888271|nr:cysteinyl leukotriene receptor 1-like [Gigantopelta aegis]
MHPNETGNVTDSISAVSKYVTSSDIGYWVCAISVVAIGLVGNSLVFPLMRDVKFSSLSYPVYLIFLTVSDSAVLLMYCIYQTLLFFNSFHIIGKNVAACRAWVSLISTATLLSPWLVVGLTLDRFVCVVFPMKRDRFCTRRKAKIVCSCLTVLSALVILPLLEGVAVVEESNICFVEDHLVIIVTFVRLVLNSNLPCLLMLVLNIVIGIHIQRSATFRKRFTSTSSGSRENKQDKSLLPLILISVMAFVTLLPSSIADTVVGVLQATNSDTNTLNVVFKNVYILMASSANYRNIITRKMNCKNIFRRKESVTVAMQTGVARPNVTELNASTSLHTDSTPVVSHISEYTGDFRNWPN